MSQMQEHIQELEATIKDLQRKIASQERDLDLLSVERDSLKEENNNLANKNRRYEKEILTLNKTVHNLSDSMKTQAPPGNSDGYMFTSKKIIGGGLNFFACVAYALDPEIRKDVDKTESRPKIIAAMKKLVSHYIMKDNSLKYKCRELQEMSTEKYIQKLEDVEYQGGEVEFRVFSKHYCCEIYSIKVTLNEIQPSFISEGTNFFKRVFLLHDARNLKNEHFEVIFAKNFKSITPEEHTVFSPKDDHAQQAALQCAGDHRKLK